MKRTKSNSRRALMASGISLALCLVMLIGTTFAWFSDSVSNKGNKITAGNLKIGFYVSDTKSTTLPAIGATDLGDWKDLKVSTDPVFTMGTDSAPAQPGDKLTKYIAIRNEGSIALKYILDFIVNDSGLGDAVTFAFKELAPNTTNVTTFTGTQLKDQKLKGSSAIKGEFAVYQMDLTFNESAGNTYQGGGFSVDLNLVATQNKDGAEFPTTINDTNSLIESIKSVPDNGTVLLSSDISVKTKTDGDARDIGKTLNMDFNGNTASSETTNDNSVFRVVGAGTVNYSNGTILASSNTFCTVLTNSAGALATLTNMTLENSRAYGNSLKALGDSKIVVRNSTVNSSLGGGAEAAGGTIDIYNSTFIQAGLSDHNSTNVAASNGGSANIHSGTFGSANYGLYVFNSGATINVYGGSFSANTVLKADKSTTSHDSIINVYGGSFTGAISIADGATLNIEAGTFSNTGLTADKFQTYVAEGSTVVETNGVFTVTK